MNERITTPSDVEEAVLEQAVRAVLVADTWTEAMIAHTLDTMLLVRRYGRQP